MPARAGVYPESRFLRSRTRTGDSAEWRSPDPNHTTAARELGLSGLCFNLQRRLSQATRFRARSTKMRLSCAVVFMVVFFCGYMRFIKAVTGTQPGRDGQLQLNLKSQNGSKPFEKAKAIVVTPADAAQQNPPRRVWKYPLVDRTVLEKLDRMQDFFAQDYGLSPLQDVEAGRDATPASQFRWPPLITRIPERPSRPLSTKPDASSAICESAKHPRPCRFLLPLRVAEQESKARVHITQLAELARRLNRTLVLPNVGKSKIGACFKWPFSTYYDTESIIDTDAAVPLNEDESLTKESYVDLESFRTWMNNRDRQRRDSLHSQLVSIAPTLPSSGLHKNAIHLNEDISVHAYSVFGAWERDLPGCFSSKFQQLKLETRPVFMSTTSHSKREGLGRPIGDSIINAFSAISPGTAQELPVLVVNWDMRYPVFPPPLTGQSLQYSTLMQSLATKSAPKAPYLVVQWRMETVDPRLLHECAHALVDVLARILHDPALAENITTVWFASDYPYPISNPPKSRTRLPIVPAKSGTFRDFEVLHEEAVNILRKAFNEQGELYDWKLTDFTEPTEVDLKAQTELLHDPGVLGILDKLVSIEADVFVSGSSRCSRRSSFTKQVVDARNVKWGRRSQSRLRNIVDTFG